MRILEVIEGRSKTGPAAAALASARGMAALGHEVSWLCRPGSPLGRVASEAGLPVIEGLQQAGWRLFAEAAAIRATAEGRDLVHVHRSRSHLAALLALGFSRRSMPLLRTCHDGLPGQTGFWGRRLVGRADGLAVRSSALAFDLRAEAASGGATLSIIPGGVDAEVFGPHVDGAGARAELKLEGQIAVGTVAHLKPGRGLFTFCRAAESICRAGGAENLRFLILGRGELLEPLASWIERSGLAGRIQVQEPGDRFPETVAALDVGVLLVPGSDGSARAALEMGALARPMVVGNVGALGDFAGSEGTWARPVNPQSMEEIACAIRDLASDSGTRDRLGRAARERFLQHYTLDSLGRNYEALAASLTSGTHREAGA
jgi:glycosyltransferase involved in cell wall biosynthesis